MPDDDLRPRSILQPQLAVRDSRRAVDFYVAAFGADELYRLDDGDAPPVVQLAVGDAVFWVQEESPTAGTASPEATGTTSVRLLLVAPDPQAAVARAVAAGAAETSPVGDEHGWRVGRIVDPFGHRWEVARPVGAWPPED